MTGSDSIFLLLLSVWLLACAGRVLGRAALVDFSREATVPLRGLLVLVVLTGHFFTRLNVIPDFRWHAYAVGAFMFMSGYGTSKSLQKKGGQYLVGYLQRMSLKLLLPLTVVMASVFLRSVSIGMINVKGLLSEYLHGQTPLCNHSWYVLELFVLSLLFWLSVQARNEIFRQITLWLLVPSLGFLLYRMGWPNGWWISIGAYPAGFTFAHCESTIRQRVKGKVGLGVFCALAVLVGMAFSLKGTNNSSFAACFLQVVLGLSIVLGCLVLPVPITCRPLTWLGAISYELYLVHGVVRNTMVRHLPHMNLFVEYILILGVSIGAAVVLQHVVKVINSALKRIHAV